MRNSTSIVNHEANQQHLKFLKELGISDEIKLVSRAVLYDYTQCKELAMKCWHIVGNSPRAYSILIKSILPLYFSNDYSLDK